MRASFMKRLGQYMMILAVLLACVYVTGCACQECRAETAAAGKALPSAQGPANDEVPPPPPSRSWRPSTRNDFATPPTDQPDPPATAPTAPPTAPPTPPAPDGGVETELVKRTRGAGIVIEQHGSGVVQVNSPGQPAPVPAAPAASAPAPLVYAPAAYPIIPGPLPDAQAIGIGKRVLGGMYYALTGNCPSKPAAAAPAAMVALTPVQTVQTVQTASYVPMYQLPAAPAAPDPTPGYAVFPPAYYASPQTAPAQGAGFVATPPTAPRKGLFGCRKK